MCSIAVQDLLDCCKVKWVCYWLNIIADSLIVNSHPLIQPDTSLTENTSIYREESFLEKAACRRINSIDLCRQHRNPTILLFHFRLRLISILKPKAHVFLFPNTHQPFPSMSPLGHSPHYVSFSSHSVRVFLQSVQQLRLFSEWRRGYGAEKVF